MPPPDPASVSNGRADKRHRSPSYERRQARRQARRLADQLETTAGQRHDALAQGQATERLRGRRVSVTHYVRGRWRFVTAGSAFHCPIPGHIPAAVQRDLRLFCHRG